MSVVKGLLMSPLNIRYTGVDGCLEGNGFLETRHVQSLACGVNAARMLQSQNHKYMATSIF